MVMSAKSQVYKIIAHLRNLRCETRCMVSPLLVIVLGVPQISLNLLVPLLLLEEAQPGLVLLARPLGKTLLRFALGSGGLLLETGEALELLDGPFDSGGFGLALVLDDLGKADSVFLLCRDVSIGQQRGDYVPMLDRRRRVASSRMRSLNSARVWMSLQFGQSGSHLSHISLTLCREPPQAEYQCWHLRRDRKLHAGCRRYRH